jgi:CubicO group peptidase (beta-lactamase class C family)
MSLRVSTAQTLATVSALVALLFQVPGALATSEIQSTAPAATSQPALGNSPRLAGLLEPIREKHHLPGLAGAILKGQAVTEIAAVGVRKLGAAEKLTIEDCFHIGSCTKAMTATVIGRLVEQGKLKWTTTIGEIFPELLPTMHADYREVTIEQLLGHRGGAPTDLTANGLWARLWTHTGPPTEQRRTLLEGVLSQPPAVKPGTTFQYSNAGYAIVGAMAEKVTGQAWEELMRKQLFEPLGMKSAGFGAPGSAGQIDQPWGHSPRGETFDPVEPGKNADNPAAIAPAGTVHCRLGDWAKFIVAHLAGARGTGGLLKPETFTKLHTPLAGQEYALGWGVVQRNWGGRVLSHAGSNTMWYAVVWISPEKNFAVLIATNAGGPVAEKATDEAASALIQHLNP